ncbi:MAG TPA: hypothetical protein VKO16_08690 [Polyangia bacterium]|nr:hypothetical protein [Polyangia bacterium]
MRGLRLLGSLLGLALLLVSPAGGGPASAATPNKCGCYRDTAGTCFCAKKGKCGCPGDCEPKGCEQQRDKEIQKEIEAETKKAEASQSKRSAADEEKDSSNVEKDSSNVEHESAKPAATASHGKMSAAQAKQLAKLIDLYLSDHPEARAKPLEDVRNDVGR